MNTNLSKVAKVKVIQLCWCELVDFYFHKKALHNLNFLKYSGGPPHCQAEISENSQKTRNKFLEYIVGKD